MPWVAVPGTLYRLGPGGQVLQVRSVKSSQDFRHLLDGLYDPDRSREDQPVKLFTYGAYQWPGDIRTRKCIDLKYKYVEHHGKEPPSEPEGVLAAVKDVLAQNRFRLVSARGKPFYFWLPEWCY